MNLERNLAEMARGKLVQQRAARYEALQYLENRGLIAQRFDLDGLRRQVWMFRNPHATAIGADSMLLAECPESDDYPTEAFVAQVVLGLAAHGRTIPERPPPTEKSEAAKQVIDWKKWAPA